MPSWWREQCRPCRTWPSSAATPQLCRILSHISSRYSEVNYFPVNLEHWLDFCIRLCWAEAELWWLQVLKESSQLLPKRWACCQVSNLLDTEWTWLLSIRKEGHAFVINVVGIASCSHHAVSGTSSQTLSSAVTVMFIPYLQQEGNTLPPHGPPTVLCLFELKIQNPCATCFTLVVTFLPFV